MAKSGDLYSENEDGTKEDAWIWEELLGEDDLPPSKYRHVIGARHDLGGEGSGNFDHVGRPGERGGSGKGEGSSRPAKIGSARDAEGGGLAIGPRFIRSMVNEEKLRSLDGAGHEHQHYVDLLLDTKEAEDYVATVTKHRDALDPADPQYQGAMQTVEKAEQAHADLKRQLYAQETKARVEIATNVGNAVIKELGVDVRLAVVTRNAPVSFTKDGKEYRQVGFFNPNTNTLEINATTARVFEPGEVRGIAAHEVMHKIHALAEGDDYDAPDPLLGRVTDEMVAENGHSAYAKKNWEAIKDGKGQYTAVKETIAEVARYLVAPESWHEQGHPAPNSKWVALVKDMIAEHHKNVEFNRRRAEPQVPRSSSQIRRESFEARAAKDPSRSADQLEQDFRKEHAEKVAAGEWPPFDATPEESQKFWKDRFNRPR